jgi:hypothetical protein
VLLVSGHEAMSAPIPALPGLTSVKIYEQTSGLATYTYAPGASELANRLSETLAFGNADAVSAAGEYYDFFCSDAAGSIDCGKFRFCTGERAQRDIQPGWETIPTTACGSQFGFPTLTEVPEPVTWCGMLGLLAMGWCDSCAGRKAGCRRLGDS